MKSLIVVVFVSALLFLQTVTALSALKYLWQSPSGKYQNRDSIPTRSIRRAIENDNIENVAEQKNVLQTRLPSTDKSNPAYSRVSFNQALQDESNGGINKFRQYLKIISVMASISRLPQNTTPQIDSALAGFETNYPAESKMREFTTDMRFLVNNPDTLRMWNLLEPGLKPFEELATSYPSVFNPVFNILDWIIFELTERSVPMLRQLVDVAQAARGDSVDKDAVSKKFKQYVQLVSVMASIARLSPTEAQEVDSGLADWETKYPTGTEMGDFIAGMQTLLKNRGAMKLWDVSEHNIKNLEELASYDPNLFNPVFYAGDAVAHELARRFSAAVQHFGEVARSYRRQSSISQE